MNISQTQRKCWETAEEHGWHGLQRSIGDIVALIHSEASEVLEEYRDGHKGDEIWWRHASTCLLKDAQVKSSTSMKCTCDPKPEGIPIECADIVIRVMDFLECEGAHLDEALRIKMKFNEGRPFLHGGKAI